MPGAVRGRGQAGRLVLQGDPVHGQRPVRGAVRAEWGIGGYRVAAGFRFLVAEEPDRLIPVARPTGPALPCPGRGQPRPGRTRLSSAAAEAFDIPVLAQGHAQHP
jgi:hypothetical protein